MTDSEQIKDEFRKRFEEIFAQMKADRKPAKKKTIDVRAKRSEDNDK